MDTPPIANLAISTLRGTPHFGNLVGRDGRLCTVWANPSKVEFAKAIDRGSSGAVAGLRGMLTPTGLYVWQNVNVLHRDFERDIGINGVRLALRSAEVLVNDETVALPEHFPWVFTEGAEITHMDIEHRRTIVAEWLRGNARLQAIYPCGFTVGWYC
jgi:hypothetical protein